MSTVSVFGIRHHGPGSARVLVRALDELAPDAVLIEGPPDAASVVEFAADPGMTPPVALLVYEIDAPSHAVYYPFAEFSPEWQALQWALRRRAAVRFIDLPQSLRPPAERSDDDASATPPPIEPPSSPSDPPDAVPLDPLEELARAAGFTDGEAWWGQLIEERHAEDNPLGLFTAIHDAMAAARAEIGVAVRGPLEPAREAYMRKSIRTALREGFARIAIVCGAWHAPVLSEAALKQHAIKADDEVLKGLPKRRTTSTWIPWTYDRLSFASGYGAGVTSPGWYEHLWTDPDRRAERWLARVARLLRDEDLDAAPASVIESVRLAASLAGLRGRRTPGLEELSEATLSVLCHGNPAPLRVIERKLIVGDKLGTVAAGVPVVPLQNDLAAQQKSLRLKVTADEMVLDLDQRKENDLARSRLLHRLRVLDIDWGTLEQDQRQRLSTFHEIWKLQWRPELAVRVIEAAHWGNTVADAAAAAVAHRARTATDLADLTAMLDHVVLADLPGAVGRLVERIQEVSARSGDVGLLMDALPPLARVLRYGNVRGTETALVEPLAIGLAARVAVGLLAACASLDDDASTAMRERIDAVHGALVTLGRDAMLRAWQAALTKVADADVHGGVAGRAARLILDARAAQADESASRLSRALSAGNDPAQAAAWLEGFLAGSGLVLVHDERLLAIVDTWLSNLSREVFEQICPIARRTFATFEKPERRQIGEKIKRAASLENQPAPLDTDDYDAARGALVEPVLRLILGDRWP
jgi:hypothetical protein